MNTKTALTEINAICHALSAGDDPDIQRFHELNEQILALIPQVSLDQATALSGGIDRLKGAMRLKMSLIQDELSTLGNKRRAMSGYGHLRSDQTAQRLFKKV